MPFTKTNRQSGPGASPGVSGNRPESSPEGPSECVSPRRPRSTLIPWLGDVYVLAVAAFQKQNRIVKDHLKIGKSLTTLLPEIALLIFAYSLSVAHDRRPRAPDRGERWRLLVPGGASPAALPGPPLPAPVGRFAQRERGLAWRFGPAPWSSCGFSRTGNGLFELDLDR